MIPIRLNLLSPGKRRVHQRTTYFQFTKNMLEVLFIFTCISGTMLLLGLGYLETKLGDITSRIAVSESKFVQKNREVDHVNSIVKRTEKIQKEYVRWIPILTDLNKALPKNIRVDSMSINWTGKSMKLTGMAGTRDALLALERQLSAVPWITPFTIPVSQLIAQENLPFDLSLTLTP